MSPGLKNPKLFSFYLLPRLGFLQHGLRQRFWCKWTTEEAVSGGTCKGRKEAGRRRSQARLGLVPQELWGVSGLER